MLSTLRYHIKYNKIENIDFSKGFCSKCAVSLAYNGIELEECVNNEDENISTINKNNINNINVDNMNRQNRIQNFLKKLHDVEIKHQKKIIDYLNSKEEIENFWQGNLEKFDIYFKEIINYINNERQKMEDYLKTQQLELLTKQENYENS